MPFEKKHDYSMKHTGLFNQHENTGVLNKDENTGLLNKHEI